MCMRKPESFSESRMRSRTSRGVPEWSGGKDLYMGSPVSGIGTSFGVIGIVPGPPEGSRGPTGWGHLPRGATWAVGGAPWPTWAKGTSPKRPMRQDIGKRGESLRGKAPPRCLGEDGLLPPSWPPHQMPSGGWPPPLGVGNPKGGAALPFPYIYEA